MHVVFIHWGIKRELLSIALSDEPLKTAVITPDLLNEAYSWCFCDRLRVLRIDGRYISDVETEHSHGISTMLN